MQAIPGSVERDEHAQQCTHREGATAEDVNRPRTVPDLLSSLMRLMRATRLAPQGTHTLTHVQWATLGMLAECGELRVSAIADHMRVDLSVASRQIAILEEVGCVERKPDPGDRRAMLVTISPEGSERLGVAKKARDAWLVEALRDWTPSEIHDAAVTIDRLQEALWTHAAHP